jgi:hypothetical protein
MHAAAEHAVVEDIFFGASLQDMNDREQCCVPAGERRVNSTCEPV